MTASTETLNAESLRSDSWHLHGFPGGIELPEQKDKASETPIESIPLPPHLVLPLRQHNGEPAIPVVSEGDRVHRGQLIAKAAEGRSAALHAPADGEISFIGYYAYPSDSGLPELSIGLCTDEIGSIEEEELVEDTYLSEEEMRARIAMAGIVGLGGAGFPTVDKLTRNPVKWLIINGAECEPYISCDDRLMRERAPAIVEGAQILGRLLRTENILLAIEDNKPEAIKAMADACFETHIQLIVIPSRYPSGAQKQLVQNLLGVEVPSGQHSVDIGIVMYNIGTCYAVARAIAHSEPLVSRIVTVSGNAVERPGNYEVMIGTPIEYLLQCACVNPNKLRRVIMGGPIMGIAINDLSAPVTKLTNCLIASGPGELDEALRGRECIRCGDCVTVCPASLLPQQLYWHIKADQLNKAARLHLDDCIECGACAVVCPSHIPLVQYYRHAKSSLWANDQQHERAIQARQRFDARELRLAQQQAARLAKRVRDTVPADAADAAPTPALVESPASTPATPIDADPHKPVIAQHSDRMAEVLAAAQRAKAKRDHSGTDNGASATAGEFTAGASHSPDSQPPEKDPS